MATETFFAISERRNSFCDGKFLKFGPGIGGGGGGGDGRSPPPPLLLPLLLPTPPAPPVPDETHLICPNFSFFSRCGLWHPSRASLELQCNCRIVQVAEQAVEGLASRIDLKSGLMAAPQDVSRVEGGAGRGGVSF